MTRQVRWLTAGAMVLMTSGFVGLTGGVAGASHTTLNEWATKHSGVLRNVTNTVLKLGESPSVQDCRNLYTVTEDAEKIGTPPEDVGQWRAALSDLHSSSLACEEGKTTKKPRGSDHTYAYDGARTLGRFVQYLDTHTIAIGQSLVTEIENAESTTTTTTSPPPTTTTLTRTHTPTSAPAGQTSTVPNVTGEKLDLAEATLLSKDIGYKVYGGGLLGVVVTSDWTVCSQTPTAGTTANAVHLVVARTCTT